MTNTTIGHLAGGRTLKVLDAKKSAHGILSLMSDLITNKVNLMIGTYQPSEGEDEISCAFKLLGNVKPGDLRSIVLVISSRDVTDTTMTFLPVIMANHRWTVLSDVTYALSEWSGQDVDNYFRGC